MLNLLFIWVAGMIMMQMIWKWHERETAVSPATLPIHAQENY